MQRFGIDEQSRQIRMTLIDGEVKTVSKISANEGMGIV